MGRGRLGPLVDVLEVLTLALVLALLTRTYILGSFQVLGDSMEPTLSDGEWVFVWRPAYLRSWPDRGDVIVFRYPLDPSRDFVKRVVGLPGEEIELRSGQIYVDGKAYRESDGVWGDRSSLPATRVPEGHLFVLGDNRRVSEDSRYFGFVPLANVRGEVFLVYWPPARIGWVVFSEGGP